MTLTELKAEIRKYQYLEDEGMIDVALASVIATRLKLGDPIWLVIIGPSSSGKSQILRPLSQMDKFMHKIDDLTENTFLSGMPGEKRSLLDRIGNHGILVLSDLTVLFSKHSESKAAILSQFRMLYDGEMTKHAGTMDKPLHWKGYLGVLAGSTPSIYDHFAEVADMGERFIYYRMNEYDDLQAARLAFKREKGADKALTDAYKEYIKATVQRFAASGKTTTVPEWVEERILKVSHFAEKIRTSTHTDFRETHINRIPVPAMRMRVALQLHSMAKGLAVMREGEITESDMHTLEWCGWSLANEEKRAILAVLGSYPYGAGVKTQTVADRIGLATDGVFKILQSLAATKVVKREGDSNNLYWNIKEEEDWNIVRRIMKIDTYDTVVQRALSGEEREESERVIDQEFETIGML